jgi:hypothetical protein
MELPFEPKKPLNQDPRFTVLFGRIKSGKTTICGAIPNSLLIDLEAKSNADEDGGSWHVECVSLKATCLKDIGQIIKAIKDWKNEKGVDPYDTIVIDHSSKLEDIADEYAVQLYKQSPQGARYDKKSMTEMGQGYGYKWIREAYVKILNQFREIAKHVVLIGHTKFTQKDSRAGGEITEMSVDLTGKLSEIVAGEADAVGYVHRKENETRICFQPSENMICGARSEHLRNKDIVVATSDEAGKVTCDWTTVFTHLK